MTPDLVFRRAADAEFVRATQWYNAERDGLGDEFAAEVQRVLDTVRRHPHLYPVARGDVRVAPVSRFPYGVYYRVRTTEVVVVAVYHHSRDPAGWQSRG